MDFEKFTNQLLDLRNKQAQEMSIYEQQFDNADFHMLQHVIDYAKMGIKALFLLNGTAAVSVLTLFTSSSIDIKNVFTPLLDAVTLFSWGAIGSVICILLAYIAQTFYQKECAYMNNEKILNIANKHYDEEKLFLIKEKNMYPNMKNYFEDKISEITSLKEKNRKENDKDQWKEKLFGRLGDLLSILSLFMVIVSLFLFGKGVNTVKNGFNVNTQPATIIEINQK